MIIQKIITWIKEWNEIIILPIMFILLVLSRPFLRFIDSTSGSFDLGVLQTTLVAAFAFAFGSVLSWFTFKLSWPKLAQWIDDSMENRLSNASKNPDYDLFHYRKAVLGIGVYFLYFAIYSWILTALL